MELRSDDVLLALTEDDYSGLSDEEIERLEVLQEDKGEGDEPKEFDEGGIKKEEDKKDAEDDKKIEEPEGKEEPPVIESDYNVLIKKKNWDNEKLAKGYTEIEKHSSKLAQENADLKKKIDEERILREASQKYVEPELNKDEIRSRASQLIDDFNDPEKVEGVLERIIGIAKNRAIEEVRSKELLPLIQEREAREEKRLRESVELEYTNVVDLVGKKYFDGDIAQATELMDNLQPEIIEKFNSYEKDFNMKLKEVPGSLKLIVSEILLDKKVSKSSKIPPIDAGDGKIIKGKETLTSEAVERMTAQQVASITEEQLDDAIAAEEARNRRSA